MTDQQELAELLAPHCRAILDRVAGEARAAGDPARRREIAARPDAEPLRREFAAFETDVLAVLEEADLT